MLNLYKSVPRDLLERSRSSVVVSLLAVTVMAVLCIAEVYEFLNPAYETSLVVEPHRVGRLAVHVSLDLHSVSCKMVNIDLASAVFRKPPVDATNLFNKNELTGDGCRITGSAQLDKSAGSVKLYFGQRDKDGTFRIPEEDVNLSHVVRYMSFTDELDVSMHEKASGPAGGVHPDVYKEGESAGQRLWEYAGPQDDQTAGMHSESNQHHDYNLQLVPTISPSNKIKMGYQYTWTENTYAKEKDVTKTADTAKAPLAITFHFQISGFTIKSQQRAVTLMELVMRLWSIIGGVYVMCMLLDGTIHSSKQFVFGRDKTL